MQVIITCFAGRKENLEILLPYVDLLVARGLVHEMHMWDFTRKNEDAHYLHTSFGNLHRTTRPYVKLFSPDKKRGWRDYYEHYTQQRYPDHVIIKCDDDVVFLDVDAFQGFIERRLANPTALVAFASIVNNGVCAHIQQRAGLIPMHFGELPYDTECGKLWGDGVLAQTLHEYFIQNKTEWLQKAHAMQGQLYRHPIGDRISINFFAILSKDLHTYKHLLYDNDDELNISVYIPILYQREVYVDMGFTVSHLSFYQQRDTGLDEPYLQRKYAQLASSLP
jgi:hypothetical protein